MTGIDRELQNISVSVRDQEGDAFPCLKRITTLYELLGAPPEVQALPWSIEPRVHGITLRRVTTKKDKDPLLNYFRKTKVNQVFVVAWAHDFTHKECYPEDGSKPEDVIFYVEPLKEYDAFLGDGLTIWEKQPVSAGLHVEIVLCESDKKVGETAKAIAEILTEIKESKFNSLLDKLPKTQAKKDPTSGNVGAAHPVPGTGQIEDLIERLQQTTGHRQFPFSENPHKTFEMIQGVVELTASPQILHPLIGVHTILPGEGFPGSGDPEHGIPTTPTKELPSDEPKGPTPKEIFDASLELSLATVKLIEKLSGIEEIDRVRGSYYSLPSVNEHGEEIRDTVFSKIALKHLTE